MQEVCHATCAPTGQVSLGWDCCSQETLRRREKGEGRAGLLAWTALDVTGKSQSPFSLLPSPFSPFPILPFRASFWS
jgi:hypothetical protein